MNIYDYHKIVSLVLFKHLSIYLKKWVRAYSPDHHGNQRMNPNGFGDLFSSATMGFTLVVLREINQQLSNGDQKCLTLNLCSHPVKFRFIHVSYHPFFTRLCQVNKACGYILMCLKSNCIQCTYKTIVT